MCMNQKDNCKEVKKQEMKNQIRFCEKCGKFRGFYEYLDKLVCCGCGFEIKK